MIFKLGAAKRVDAAAKTKRLLRSGGGKSERRRKSRSVVDTDKWDTAKKRKHHSDPDMYCMV